MISGEDFERRLRMLSQHRALALGLRRAAMEAYAAGKIPYKPAYDIRSDYGYWRKLAKEKGIRVEEAASAPTGNREAESHG